ncbi:Reverse transcriptase Ty1/copia-type domain-containing protein [Abeliophyllum distichum]|uniref:Reverse transcriptase Ty1/copia-type domain-containing protein n=1 Tax=Abeliophyllum distichum TaxID=126358 RepID=A0ABD1SA16_9LAMI
MHHSLNMYFYTSPKKKQALLNGTYETMIENSQDQEVEEEVEIEPTRSKRERTKKSYGPDFLTYMLEIEPQSFKESVNSSEGPQWREAIKSEIDSIMQNHTWELVDLPPGCKPLGYK